MMGHTFSAVTVLIGLFVCAFVYIVARYFYFGFEFEEIHINKRQLFYKYQLLKKAVALTPIIGYLIYLLIQNKMELVESTVILVTPLLFLMIHEFIF